MIRFSFSSLCMSVMFALFMILSLYILFHYKEAMEKLGFPLLNAILWLTIIRIVFPIELLFLSHNILLPELPSAAIATFISPAYLKNRFSLWSFVELLWIVGILFYAVTNWRAERKASARIRANLIQPPNSSAAYQTLRKIQTECPRMRYLEIYFSPNVISPSIHGLRKPCILLPTSYDLDDEELYYTLFHELFHDRHYDLFFKLGIYILTTIYWWNPLCKYLRKKSDTILEMRVDRAVSRETNQKERYYECIIQIAIKAAHALRCNGLPNMKRQESMPSETSLVLNNVREVISKLPISKEESPLRLRRSVLFREEHKWRDRIVNTILIGSLLSLFCLSYLYIFEPFYSPPEHTIGTFNPTKENSYFIRRPDGRYNLYFNNNFITTEESLEYYDDAIPIYEHRKHRKEVNICEED